MIAIAVMTIAVDDYCSEWLFLLLLPRRESKGIGKRVRRVYNRV